MATSPIHFRMPEALRVRLRRFAGDRHLSEAEALRLVLSEHLDEFENERELAEAERWQFKAAYDVWQRDRRGEGKFVGWEEVERLFTEARSSLQKAPKRSK